MKICCAILICLGLLTSASTFKVGMMFQELLGYRQEAALQDKAKTINVDINNPRLGPIVERKHGK